MEIGALDAYESALLEESPLDMVSPTGSVIQLDIARYLAPSDDVDAGVLDRCRGPVLDIGCGPGRMVRSLAERGISALGVDVAPTAIGLSRQRGAAALQRSVFQRIPGEGRWATALLLDGNLGIGGDVDRLLRRSVELLAERGRVIVEAHPDPSTEQFLEVRFRRSGRTVGPPFPWAVVGADVLIRRAEPAGLYSVGSWSAAGRSFVELERRASRITAVA